MSGQLVLALSAPEARVLTDEVKVCAHELWFRLRQLHEGGAHTALGYSSWAAYCAAEFDMGASRAYQLLDAGRVAAAVDGHSTTVEPPANEAQARELAPVLRDEGEAAVVEVWRELRDEYGDDVTAKRVKQVVKNRLAREGRDRTAAERRERKWEKEPLHHCDGCDQSTRAASGYRDRWKFPGGARGSRGDYYEHTYCGACYVASGLAAEDARRYADDLDAGRGHCDFGHGWTDGRYEWGGWACSRCKAEWQAEDGSA